MNQAEVLRNFSFGVLELALHDFATFLPLIVQARTFGPDGIYGMAMSIPDLIAATPRPPQNGTKNAWGHRHRCGARGGGSLAAALRAISMTALAKTAAAFSIARHRRGELQLRFDLEIFFRSFQDSPTTRSPQ
jgi:hypothetical protein